MKTLPLLSQNRLSPSDIIPHNFLSNALYCIASATWLSSMSDFPSKSATVLDNFSILSYALPESDNCRSAAFSSSLTPGEMWHNWRACLGALQRGGLGEAFGLDFASAADAFADCDGGFAGEALVGHLVLLEAGDLDVDVDAVEEGAGNALQVLFDLSVVTRTRAQGVAEVAAGAGVHGGDHHELSGVGERRRDAGDGDLTVFERLAEHFEDVPAELGELVEEEDAIVRLRDFTRTRHGAAAAQARLNSRNMYLYRLKRGHCRGREKPGSIVILSV